jgi:hypothetical protein
MKTTQTEEELLEHLQEQIHFLSSSCKSYDDGYRGEAKRIASVIRTLVHDTKNSISLLKQLDSKNIYFYNTSLPINLKNLMPHMGLIGIQHSPTGIEYWPPLDDGPPSRYQKKWVTFDTWWNEIVLDDKMKRFSRKDLVLFVTNKDGGSHVDPVLEVAYANLSRKNSLGWKKIINGNESDMTKPELTSIRQIGHEMYRTLKNRFSSYFNE